MFGTSRNNLIDLKNLNEIFFFTQMDITPGEEQKKKKILVHHNKYIYI